MSGLGENIFVTGSNRGIGLAIVENLIKNHEIKRIFAACRDPSSAQELRKVWNHVEEKLYIIQLDVQDDTSISLAYEKIERILGDEPLNTLINNAGIAERQNASLLNASREVFTRQFDVNTTGTVMVTSKFMPLLSKASEMGKRALIINISSTMGSLQQTILSASQIFAYGMSKAALNQFTRLSSKLLEDSNIIVVSICPGSVKTDMGGETAIRPLEEVIPPLLESISKLTKKDSGRFINRFGEDIPF